MTINHNLDLKIIEPSDKLNDYLEKEELTLLKIAKAYFEISKNIYSNLIEYPSDISKLETIQRDILILIKNIQNKEVEQLRNEGLLDKAKDNVRSSWGNLVSGLEFLNSHIQNLRNLKFEHLSIILSVGAIVLSVISLFVSFL